MASLAWRTRWPHYHLKEHTEAELKLIRDMRRRNPSLGLSECGYTYDQIAYIGSCEGCGCSRGIRVECVQTDNGFEFTNRFSNRRMRCGEEVAENPLFARSLGDYIVVFKFAFLDLR